MENLPTFVETWEMANGNLAYFSCLSRSQINLFVMIFLKKVTDKAEVKKRIV